MNATRRSEHEAWHIRQKKTSKDITHTQVSFLIFGSNVASTFNQLLHFLYITRPRRSKWSEIPPDHISAMNRQWYVHHKL